MCGEVPDFDEAVGAGGDQELAVVAGAGRGSNQRGRPTCRAARRRAGPTCGSRRARRPRPRRQSGGGRRRRTRSPWRRPITPVIGARWFNGAAVPEADRAESPPEARRRHRDSRRGIARRRAGVCRSRATGLASCVRSKRRMWSAAPGGEAFWSGESGNRQHGVIARGDGPQLDRARGRADRAGEERGIHAAPASIHKASEAISSFVS